MRFARDDVVSLLESSILCVFFSKFCALWLRSKSCSKLEEHLFSPTTSFLVILEADPEAVGVVIILSEMVLLLIGVLGAAFVLDIDLEGLANPV